MLIALDYDGTYTADPVMWDRFIESARARCHEVMIVTGRTAAEVVRLGAQVDRVVYCDGKAKRSHMRTLGLDVQVWIDDMPEMIVYDSAPRDLAANSAAGLWSPQ